MAAEPGLPRPLEACIALSGLVVLSPVLMIAAVLIKTTSPGPVLFCQRRVGKNGRNFTLYKFRSMTVAQRGPLVTAASDGRITAVGKILRKSKLDEVPGLWNVVRGEMSLVGPRPEVPQLVDLDSPQWQRILSVRPGITDPVAIRMRNEEDLLAQVADQESFYREILQPYKMKGYIKFVDKKSLSYDLKIIFRTLRAVIQPNSAPLPSLDEVKGDFVETF